MDTSNTNPGSGAPLHGEEVHVEKVEKMEVGNKTQSLLVPLSIIIAGGLIGAGLYFGGGGKGLAPIKPGTPSSPGSTATPPGTKADVTVGDLPVMGDPNAPVTIVEWADYQCPFCGRFFETVESQIIETYVKTGKARFAYRDFAFLGPESEWAANAARCANEQGKFWEYHDKLFTSQQGENQGAFSKDKLKAFGRELGLDTAKFNSCVDSNKYSDAINADTQAGQAVGVQGTPATFVNGIQVSGAQPWANFQQLIEAELKK